MQKKASNSVAWIDELSGGFRAAQVLLTAGRLGVFQALGHRRLKVEALSDLLDCDLRGTRILCRALVSIGLLELNGQFLKNSEVALKHFVSDAPNPKIAQLKHMAKLYARWAGLYGAVRTGAAVPDIELDPELLGSRRDFAKAMADSSRESALLTAEKLDLSGSRALLDVGGGPGSFAIEFVRRNPRLTVTIIDDEETLGFAAEMIDQADLPLGRIELLPGDALRDPLHGPYDFIFISNVIHIFSSTQNRALIKRCSKVLTLDGRIGIKDFFIEENRIGSTWAALFAVNMLVSTEGGDCYSLDQVQDWLESAHMEFIQQVPITEKSSVIIGQKVAR